MIFPPQLLYSSRYVVIEGCLNHLCSFEERKRNKGKPVLTPSTMQSDSFFKFIATLLKEKIINALYFQLFGLLSLVQIKKLIHVPTEKERHFSLESVKSQPLQNLFHFYFSFFLFYLSLESTVMSVFLGRGACLAYVLGKD